MYSITDFSFTNKFYNDLNQPIQYERHVTKNVLPKVWTNVTIKINCITTKKLELRCS